MPNGRRGNRGNRPGMGPSGPGGQPAMCICPECGHEMAHKRGVPCVQISCPNCGIKMIRKD